jgi:hypothetical protein
MAKRRTAKKPVRRRARKKDNSTIWILAALAAGVAYLMSKGTINVPGPGVLNQAHQDQITTASDTSLDVVTPYQGKPLLYNSVNPDNYNMV